MRSSQGTQWVILKEKDGWEIFFCRPTAVAVEEQTVAAGANTVAASIGAAALLTLAYFTAKGAVASCNKYSVNCLDLLY